MTGQVEPRCGAMVNTIVDKYLCVGEFDSKWVPQDM